MKEAKGQDKKARTAGKAPELRVVGVEFKPAPDAQDRLRRLFTILAGHFDERDADERKQNRSTDECDLGAK